MGFGLKAFGIGRHSDEPKENIIKKIAMEVLDMECIICGKPIVMIQVITVTRRMESRDTPIVGFCKEHINHHKEAQGMFEDIAKNKI